MRNAHRAPTSIRIARLLQTLGLLLPLMLVVIPARADAASGGLSCSTRVQPGQMRLCRARTDNYKDCFNSQDDMVETRTWLSLSRVRARGAVYALDAGQDEFATSLHLHRVGGRRGAPRRVRMVARAVSGTDNVASVTFRADATTGMWGPLLELRRQVRAGESVGLVVTLQRRGHRWARVRVTYRRDDALADAPAGSVEFNGPGGRFWVRSRRTRTDWELGSGAEC